MELYQIAAGILILTAICLVMHKLFGPTMPDKNKHKHDSPDSII